jgi:hypothetical protein
MAEDKAGIYFFGPPPSVERVAAAAAGARVSTSQDGRFTRISIAWPDVTLVVAIDPRWNREVQLSGVRGWIGRFPPAERNTARVKAFLSDLDRTTASFGSVVTPAFDREGKVADMLLRLVQPDGGFFFAYQSLYDSRGSRVVGLPGDPGRLGRRD